MYLFIDVGKLIQLYNYMIYIFMPSFNLFQGLFHSLIYVCIYLFNLD